MLFILFNTCIIFHSTRLWRMSQGIQKKNENPNSSTSHGLRKLSTVTFTNKYVLYQSEMQWYMIRDSCATNVTKDAKWKCLLEKEKAFANPQHSHKNDPHFVYKANIPSSCILFSMLECCLQEPIYSKGVFYSWSILFIYTKQEKEQLV